MQRTARYQAGVALIALVIVTSCASRAQSSVPQPATPALTPAMQAPRASLPAFSHIFTIVLENKDYGEVLGNRQAPYTSALAQTYAIATNYYGISRPSLPNYIAMTSGDTFGIASNCIDCFLPGPNLIDQLEASGKSWKAYMEDMPSPCFVGDAPPLYRQKHNPFIYYDTVRTDPARCNKIVPFTQFATDLAANALPAYVWITPNMCNSAHDCPVATSDRWLQTVVPQILASPAWKDNGVLFITFDEGTPKSDTGSCCQHGNGGHIATLVVSPLVQAGFQSQVGYDHYSLLRTIEDAWGLPQLGQARCTCSPAMTDFFAPVKDS